MALTPEGTPYVESSDLVANYPAASLALANRVDLVGVLPFATSAARATAIPSPTDGQFTYLQDTNTTQFWNGSAWVNAGGKILQVVNATYAVQTNTSSATYVDTGLTATITPSSTTSKILVTVNQSGLFKASDAYMLLQLIRTSTSIIEFERYLMNLGNANQLSIGSASTSYLDAPATATAVTYKTQFRSSFATRSVTVQVDSSVSTITLMEVGA